MQFETPKIKGWGKTQPNVVEKTYEGRWKKGMTKWANNQTFAPSLAHNFKCIQCKSKGN